MKIQLFNQPSKKTRRFLLFLPIICVPFLTLIFWIMGGGNGSSLMAKTASENHLLSTLPEVDLSAQKGLDKMSYYEKATADSIRNGVANEGSSFWEKNYSDASWRDESREIDYSNSYNPEQQENELQMKLNRLNEVMNQPEQTGQYVHKEFSSNKNKQLSKTQSSLNSIGNRADPELEQLNGMLEKIWEIQNPNAVSETNATSELGSIYQAIPAVIEGKQKLGQGSVVKLRLLEDVKLNNQLIPKGHLIFGICNIMNQRLQLDITSIRVGKSLLPVDLSTYDMIDGMEGINVPDALINDAMKSGSDNAIQSLQFLPFDQSMETQIAGAGISAAKGLFSKQSKCVKVKLQDGYQVLLKNNQK